MAAEDSRAGGGGVLAGSGSLCEGEEESRGVSAVRGGVFEVRNRGTGATVPAEGGEEREMRCRLVMLRSGWR